MLPPPKDLKRPKPEVGFTLNAFGRWIIHKKDDFSKAWSGSRFVKVSLSPFGLPLKVQICNFETFEKAREYWEAL